MSSEVSPQVTAIPDVWCIRRTVSAHGAGFYACIGYAGSGPRCPVTLDVLPAPETGGVVPIDHQQECLTGVNPIPEGKDQPPMPVEVRRQPPGTLARWREAAATSLRAA